LFQTISYLLPNKKNKALIFIFIFQGMNVLFEFFILQELKNNKEMIENEKDNINFFADEKLVELLYIISLTININL